MRKWTDAEALAVLREVARRQRGPEAECGACGEPLDADCDHCCRACLGGETCPACAPEARTA